MPAVTPRAPDDETRSADADALVARRAAGLVTAPAGAALLARLETGARSDWRAPWDTPPDSVPSAVAAAAAVLPSTPVDEVLTEAVAAAEHTAGPWTADAPVQLAVALRLAPDRRPLAEAVARRLAGVWSAPLDPAGQVWFTDDEPFEPDRSGGPGGRAGATGWAPLGSPRRPCDAWVTATWQGLWTATAPGDRLAAHMADTWEMFRLPVTRWRLLPDPGARVLELDGPDAWAALASDHPLARRVRPESSWEVPGVNPPPPGVRDLAALPGQRAVRTTMRHFVEPDWDSVAAEWDAVHLTWSGFLLAEGTAVDLGGGDVAMLRNWRSERTLWLNPVLAAAEPLPAVPPPEGADPPPRPDDLARRAWDAAWLTHRLGRPTGPALPA